MNYLCSIFILTSITICSFCGTHANSILPRFIYPPELVNSTLSTIAIQLYNSTTGIVEPKTFQIQYKEQIRKYWQNATELVRLTFPLIINIHFNFNNYSVENVVLLRAVLYTKKHESYQEDDVPYIETNTMCRNISADTKLIQGFKVRVSVYHVDLNWIPICQATFQVTIKCVENPWCPKNIIVDNYKCTKKSLSYYHGIIMPYTNYTVELQVLTSTESVSHAVRTLTSMAPGVRNMTIYSQDDSYIAVKWQPPYPPYGLLEHYKLVYEMCNNNYNSNVILRNPEPCELWENYVCYKINNLIKDTCYTVSISAKNIEEDYGVFIDRNAYTTQAMSAPPINLTATWNDDDKLTLTWNHPHKTAGELVGFYIHITQTDSEIVSRSAYEFTPRYFAIDKPQRSYSYTLDEILPLSTTYQISVQGMNKHLGHNSTINADAPPVTPALESYPVLGTRTKMQQKIKISPMKSKTLSHTGYLYVVVCDPSMPMNEPSDMNKILEMIRCEGKSWVTLELPANGFEIKTFIGDTNIAYSKTLHQTLQNTALDAGSSYTISIVLVNEYKSKQRYNIYTLNVSSYFNPAVYAWFLLLLLLPIGWFVYRYIQKRKAENNEPLDHTKVRYSTHNPNIHRLSVPPTAEQKLIDQVEMEFFEQ